MSFNKSEFAFDDVREILDKALAEAKGLMLVLETRGAAINARSRFNYFRQLDRKSNRETYPIGDPMHGRSVYDKLVLRVPAQGAADANVLYIEHRRISDFDIRPIQ